MVTIRSRVLAVAAILAIALAGCSSTRTMENVARDEAAAQATRDKADKERTAREQIRLEQEVSATPGWATRTPRPDQTGVYAVGMGRSVDMQTAVRKATLQAQYGTAEQLGLEISGSEKQFTREGQTRSGQQQYTLVIDKLVAAVPVGGYEVVEQAVKPIDGMYHAWILVKLPYDELNHVARRASAAATDAAARSEFDDLERRVRQRQAARQQEADHAQEMRLAELERKAKIVVDGVPARDAKGAPEPRQ